MNSKKFLQISILRVLEVYFHHRIYFPLHHTQIICMYVVLHIHLAQMKLYKQDCFIGKIYGDILYQLQNFAHFNAKCQEETNQLLCTTVLFLGKFIYVL